MWKRVKFSSGIGLGLITFSTLVGAPLILLGSASAYLLADGKDGFYCSGHDGYKIN